MSNLSISKEQNEELVAAHPDGEYEFTTQDLEELNKNDAESWLENDELVGLVSESEGGIIGYVHRAHAEKIATALNLHILNTNE